MKEQKPLISPFPYSSPLLWAHSPAQMDMSSLMLYAVKYEK